MLVVTAVHLPSQQLPFPLASPAAALQLIHTPSSKANHTCGMLTPLTHSQNTRHATCSLAQHQIVLKLLRTESGLHKVALWLERWSPPDAWIALFWYETQLYKRLQAVESVKIAALEVCAG
jgi:hypothetical protein